MDARTAPDREWQVHQVFVNLPSVPVHETTTGRLQFHMLSSMFALPIVVLQEVDYWTSA